MLSVASLIKAVLLPLNAILFGYGLVVWRQHRNHFIIANRFPTITFFIVVTTYCLQITSLVGDIVRDSVTWSSYSRFEFYDTGMRGFKMAICFSLLSAAAIRSLLFCSAVQKMALIITNSPDQCVLSAQMQARSTRLCRAMMLFTVIGFLAICSLPLTGFPPVVFFFGSMIVILTVILVRLTKLKPKDEIHCVKEIVFNIVSSLMLPAMAAAFPGDVASVSGFIFITCIAAVPLYLPIYYMRVIENRATTARPRLTDSESAGSVSGCVSPAVLRQPLHLFLGEKEHYVLFREYLSHCLALESLMFIESALMVRHLLLNTDDCASPSIASRASKTDTDIVLVLADSNSGASTQQLGRAPTPREMNSAENTILAMRFEYLEDSHEQYLVYKEKINDSADVEWEQKRQVLFDICADIYKKFIQNDALHEINIPHDVRSELDLTFSEEENTVLDRFKTVEDISGLFVDAVQNVYTLLVGVYVYNFSTYMRKTCQSQEI